MIRIFLIIFLIIYPYYLNSKVINLKYEIDWKSIHLADLFWKIKIEDNLYEIDFTIKSYGVTDKIYGYESITKVSGEIKDDSFNPIIYKSKTKSSKQDRFENIIFNKKISNDKSKEKKDTKKQKKEIKKSKTKKNTSFVKDCFNNKQFGARCENATYLIVITVLNKTCVFLVFAFLFC